MRDKHEEDEDTEDDVGGDINVGVDHWLFFLFRELEELEAIKEAEEAALAEAEAAAAEAAAEAAAGLFGDDDDEDDMEKGDEGGGGGSEVHSRTGAPSPAKEVRARILILSQSLSQQWENYFLSFKICCSFIFMNFTPIGPYWSSRFIQ